MGTPVLADFHDVIDWTRGIEEQASRLYQSAAARCAADVPFARFLAELAREESSHAGYLVAAAEQLCRPADQPRLDIVLDEKTRGQVQNLLERFERLLDRPTVTKRDVVEYLARLEASEWNPVFLYVMEEYRRTGREGEHVTRELQEHLGRIQDFVDTLGRDLRPSIHVSTLPRVSEPRFLVVDDSGPLRRLMASLLGRQGAVDTAAEGRAGLEKIKSHFHDVVVSDIQMPGIDGLEFHRQAAAYDDRLRRRFVLCTADVSAEAESYARKNRVRLLKKPFGLDEFHEAVAAVMKAHGGSPTT